MSRTIGKFVVGRETEIASSGEKGKTSQLLYAEIEDQTLEDLQRLSGLPVVKDTLVWFEVEGREPEIIAQYSPLNHVLRMFIPFGNSPGTDTFIPAKETP